MFTLKVGLCQMRHTFKKNLAKYFSSKAMEQKVNVGDQVINYVKVGNGEHPVLCFPGALGSIWSDFKPQVESLDRDKFTVVAWDPPGYGHSRPPPRKFHANFYETDAEIAYKFMNILGFTRFSLLGWSDGGISSLILAATRPEAVRKLVVWGANAYVVAEEVDFYESIRDVKSWSPKMRQPLEELYGEQGFQDLWNEWCDTLRDIFARGGDICKGRLPLIKCPTLVVHGRKDPIVAPEHPGYLVRNIENARYRTFEDGKHNIHLRYAQEFNTLVSEFLLE